MTLAFGGPPGSELTMTHAATTRLRSFSATQIRRDRRETVDFTTVARVLATEHENVRTRVRTILKDGHGSLHAMAFPEINESIDLLTTPLGRVVRAGAYPADGVFFIPSLPMPDHAVTIGDTWEMEHEWISNGDRMPLRIEVVGILKNIFRGADDHVVADLEISGHILVNARADHPNARFDSRVRGRAWFDVDLGQVVWTEVHSREEITLGADVSLIESCLVSRAGRVRVACAPEYEHDVRPPARP